MRFLLAGLGAAVALTGAGCGGGGGPTDVLSETASNLSEIRSGNLSLTLLVDPEGGGADGVGFELNGPFALRGTGRLPVARLVYTQLAGKRRGTATLISTGEEAFVEIAGKAYRLPPEQVAQLRGAAGQLESEGGLEELGIENWFEEPELSDGGDVGGAETDRVHGELNTVNAANDLLDLARDLGRIDFARIQGQTAEQLSQAARSATFELFTGKDDRLLRRLTVDVELGFDVPKDLEQLLGAVVGADVLFELGVADPNSAVSVQAPANPLPASELPGSE